MPLMTVNGVKTYYIERGSGTPIIFVHPPVLSSTCFVHQLNDLSGKFKTIAFDIRGHGMSQPSKEVLTYELIATDIKALMDALDIEKAFLCGYSTGGSIILQFLLSYPERAFGGIITGGMSEVHDFRLKMRISLGIASAQIGAMNVLAMSLAWTNSSRVIFWKMFNNAKTGNSENVEQYYRQSLTYNGTKQLPQIHAPVLLVYGKKDKEFHSYGELLHQRLPQSELVFIPNVKHQIPTKATRQLHEAMINFTSIALKDF